MKLKVKVGSIGVYQLFLSEYRSHTLGGYAGDEPAFTSSAETWQCAELGVTLILKNIRDVGGMLSVK